MILISNHTICIWSRRITWALGRSTPNVTIDIHWFYKFIIAAGVLGNLRRQDDRSLVFCHLADSIVVHWYNIVYDRLNTTSARWTVCIDLNLIRIRRRNIVICLNKIDFNQSCRRTCTVYSRFTITKCMQIRIDTYTYTESAKHLFAIRAKHIEHFSSASLLSGRSWWTTVIMPPHHSSSSFDLIKCHDNVYVSGTSYLFLIRSSILL